MLSTAPILSFPPSAASTRVRGRVDFSEGLGSCGRAEVGCHSTEMRSRQSSAVPPHRDRVLGCIPPTSASCAPEAPKYWAFPSLLYGAFSSLSASF